MSEYRDPAAQIVRLMKEQGRTASFLARKVGVTKQSVGNWLTGRSSPQDPKVWDAMLEALGEDGSAKLNVSESVLPYPRDDVRVPVYGAITAGSPGCSQSDVVDYVEVPSWSGPTVRWGRYVTGESMEPEFSEGDVAIFENRPFDPGHAVHAFHAGEDAFKFYRLIDGRPQLWPINKEFEPFDAQEWSVKGVCVQRLRREAFGNKTLKFYAGGLRWRMIQDTR